eukprot:768187-Hanusia_phi.AAC.4
MPAGPCQRVTLRLPGPGGPSRPGGLGGPVAGASDAASPVPEPARPDRETCPALQGLSLTGAEGPGHY